MSVLEPNTFMIVIWFCENGVAAQTLHHIEVGIQMTSSIQIQDSSASIPVQCLPFYQWLEFFQQQSDG